MASGLATRRLRKELASLKKTPIENIEALPLESNILEWHYVLRGTPGSPYEGGIYHGKLKFPPEYPMKPPAVIMFTPNGTDVVAKSTWRRFKTNRRLCLSMSDFHPESWNPMWSVGSILTGLYSFMLDTAPTLGSLETSDTQKKALAQRSLEANLEDPLFRKCFPQYVEAHRMQAAKASIGTADQAVNGKLKSQCKQNSPTPDDRRESSSTILLVGIGVIFLAVLLLTLQL